MKAVIFVRVEQGQESMQMIQAQVANSYAQTIGASVIGYSMKVGMVPISDLLSIIKADIASDFDSIIAYSKDVLSTNIQELYQFVNECFEQEIDIHTNNDGNLTHFFRNIIQAKELNDTKKLSIETVKRMKRAFENEGKFLGGRPKFGYTRHGDGSLIIDPKQANIVREIYRLYDDGMSLTTISRIIADKFNLHYDGKGRWRQQKLKEILSNPIYIGSPIWRRHKYVNGKPVPLPENEWVKAAKRIDNLVIVENDLWEAVQNRLSQSSAS